HPGVHPRRPPGEEGGPRLGRGQQARHAPADRARRRQHHHRLPRSVLRGAPGASGAGRRRAPAAGVPLPARLMREGGVRQLASTAVQGRAYNRALMLVLSPGHRGTDMATLSTTPPATERARGRGYFWAGIGVALLGLALAVAQFVVVKYLAVPWYSPAL